MEYVKRVADHAGARADKFYKATLFRGDALLLGVNCLEPGQAQPAHDHADQDKFYFVVEGVGRFQVGDSFATAAPPTSIPVPSRLLRRKFLRSMVGLLVRRRNVGTQGSFTRGANIVTMENKITDNLTR